MIQDMAPWIKRISYAHFLGYGTVREGLFLINRALRQTSIALMKRSDCFGSIGTEASDK